MKFTGFMLLCIFFSQGYAQTAVVSADKMNVLYIGIDNPVSIAATKYDCKDLVVEISQGKIIYWDVSHLWYGRYNFDAASSQIAFYFENDNICYMHSAVNETSIITIKKFEIAEHIIKNHVFAAVDLNHVNFTYKKVKKPAIQGILGSEILLVTGAVIDYGKKQLTLDP